MPNYQARLQKVQQKMSEAGVDLLFLSRSANLDYVTGIHREEPNFGNTIYPGEWITGGWIPQSGAPILTLPRMLAEFHMGAVTGYDVRVLPDAGDPLAYVRDILTSLKIKSGAKIAVEDRCWAETVLNLQSLVSDLQLSLASKIMMPLRRIKDDEELAILREAGQVTVAAYQATLKTLRHGMTTLDLTSEVKHQLRKHGATTDSFVTSFYNMGRNFPFDFTNREAMLQVPLLPPVSISFDMGAAYKDYCYDFGRSVHFGEPDAEYRKVYGLVMAAQAAGIKALKAGNTCAQADQAARAVIADAGYGHAFRHRLGHGIGKDVHEPPFLTVTDHTVMEPGMCFTIEPSIFIPHQFGARVEDIVVVGKAGGIPLTSGFGELYVVS